MTPDGRGASRFEGIVLESLGGRYRLRLDDGREVTAVLRGRLRQEARTGNRVVAGDRVRAEPISGEEGFTLEEILPRHNELVRAGAGGRGARVVVANLDRCLVVLSAVDPPFDPEVADRFLALAESCGIPPTLILNKVDLLTEPSDLGEALQGFRDIGYETLRTSVKSGEGMEALEALLSSGILALIGPSGVGKSSLLNALDPGRSLRTQEVGTRGGRGRHTTVSARLLPIASGGWIADTPGFSDVRLWEVDLPSLAGAFPEFEVPAQECRFSGCSHLHEPGCAVRQGVDRGEISARRYGSYRAMAEGSER